MLPAQFVIRMLLFSLDGVVRSYPNSVRFVRVRIHVQFDDDDEEEEEPVRKAIPDDDDGDSIIIGRASPVARAAKLAPEPQVKARKHGASQAVTWSC